MSNANTLTVWTIGHSTHTLDDFLALLDLSDGRLNKRVEILMEQFVANPTASISIVCESWAETCAAYRFLDNDVPISGIKMRYQRDNVRH